MIDFRFDQMKNPTAYYTPESCFGFFTYNGNLQEGNIVMTENVVK